MTVEERDRLALFEALKASIGSDHAMTFLELVPPVGWSDIATKDDLYAVERSLRGEMAELRGDLRSEMAELRSDMAELRSESRSGLAQLATEIHRSSRQMMALHLGTMIAIFGYLLAAA